MISGLFTLAAIASFIGVCWWAGARRNAARFAEAAHLPLVDDLPEARAPVKAPVKACCSQEKVS